MNLELERKEFWEDRTLGGLYINGNFFCHTLEDKDRHLESGGQKIPKETAIPTGRYKVIIDFSNRFQRKMPHILEVPFFEGIRIHTGNVPANTEGCILLGTGIDLGTHNITGSKIAFDNFFPRLEAGLKEGEVWIEIK